jgi:pre-mRNA-splicing factor CDC5/CEF1
VLIEVRNLRNMTIAQTPLLGDENTPLHVGPGGGVDFGGATPRHSVSFTPNPPATPFHDGAANIPGTPRTDLKSGGPATPLRTPVRDNLSINATDGQFAVGDTPREHRRRENPLQRALKASFSNLPKQFRAPCARGRG